MCILSIAKNDNKIIFTFSRDENPDRKSTQPDWINPNVYMPIDLLQNGTWIGYNESLIISLQNGGKIKHQRKPKYDLSRGIILKKILLNEINLKDLNFDNMNVEPFTITVLNLKNLELTSVWFDGAEIHKESLEYENGYLNTSCTLYTNELHLKLNQIFNNLEINEKDLLDLHKNIRIGSKNNPPKGIVETVSITQFVIENDKINSTFCDLISQKEYHNQLK